MIDVNNYFGHPLRIWQAPVNDFRLILESNGDTLKYRSLNPIFPGEITLSFSLLNTYP
jgi:hypothetical protein